VTLRLFSLISESRARVGSLRLSDWFNRPVIVESGDNYDFLSRGMATQPEELTDINFDVEIKHFLFRRGMPFGGDLRAIDIQRNRDHGLASYNDFREFCGLRRANAWEDFLDLISQRVSSCGFSLSFTALMIPLSPLRTLTTLNRCT
jgi:peroxidase